MVAVVPQTRSAKPPRPVVVAGGVAEADPVRVRISITRVDGLALRIARKGIESSQRLGRHRRTVERTVAWLAGCRRLHRRYERKAEHFPAFAGTAAILICCRRLPAWNNAQVLAPRAVTGQRSMTWRSRTTSSSSARFTGVQM